MPKRIQFKRQKGFRLPPNCVRVTRPSKFGNPFKVGDYFQIGAIPIQCLATPENCLSVYESYLQDKLEENLNFLAPLKGKDLACFCPLESKCHADILLKYANR